MKWPEYLTPKTPQQLVIMLIIVAILIFVISQFVMPELKALRVIMFGYKGTDGTKSKPVSEARKTELETGAKSLYDAIYSWWDSVNPDHLEWLYNLPDNEFIYYVNYYNSELTSNNLAYDIDWENLPNTGQDENVIKRMKDMGFEGSGWLEAEDTKVGNTFGTGFNLPFLMGATGTVLITLGTLREQGKI